MGLAPGTSIGPFRINGPLGKGGMGEVFSATDTRLDRKVALKLLPPGFAADPERLRRFQSEAKALAALTHPNVLAIFEVGTSDGQLYLVSELLEGETLREKLNGGAIPQRSVVEIALQLAAGLAAAHAKRIVHRDLKPENVFLTRDGRAKILDFGLAKSKPAKKEGAVDPDAVTALPQTEPGLVMGTTGYMSPEQVKGDVAGPQSDIFAFGAVLYEMLSGARAFRKETTIGTMNAILTEEPRELSECNVHLSPGIERVVRRCLEKQPERRFQSASDLAFALETLANETPSTARAVARKPKGASWRARELWAWGVVGALVVLGGLLWALSAHRAMVAPPVMRLSIIVPPEHAAEDLAISPDGRNVAFMDSGQDKNILSVRPLAGLDLHILPDTSGAEEPFWSPDGRSLGFFADGKLKTVVLEGGRARTLCAARGAGGTWNQFGVILYSEYWGGGLFKVSAEGGDPMPVTTLDVTEVEDSHLWPRFLPDGKHFLYLAKSSSRNKSTIWVGSLDPNERRRRLMAADALVGYHRESYVLFGREGALYAQRMDGRSYTPQGPASMIVEQAAFNGQISFMNASCSENGVLVYRSETHPMYQLTWLNRSGLPFGTVGPPGRYWTPRLSLDEKQVAVQKFDPKTATMLACGSCRS